MGWAEGDSLLDVSEMLILLSQRLWRRPQSTAVTMALTALGLVH